MNTMRDNSSTALGATVLGGTKRLAALGGALLLGLLGVVGPMAVTAAVADAPTISQCATTPTTRRVRPGLSGETHALVWAVVFPVQLEADLGLEADSLEDVGGDRQKALGRVPLGDLLDVRDRPPHLVDDDHRALRLTVRPHDVGGDLIGELLDPGVRTDRDADRRR